MKIGLTGHQNIGSKSDIKWVKGVLSEEIEKQNITCGISCLAVGADQLYAEILKVRHLPFIVIIPSDGYETTFDETSELPEYKRLLLTAEEIIRMKFSSPTEEAFYAAGKEVVNRSEMMFAIWNGKKAQGLGGTADIVEFAKAQRKKIIHINPVNRTVTQI